MLDVSKDNALLLLTGNWTTHAIVAMPSLSAKQIKQLQPELTVDGSHLKKVDTAGALALVQLQHTLEAHHKTIEWVGLANNVKNLMALVTKNQQPKQSSQDFINYNIFYRLGKQTYDKYRQADHFLMFIGELALTFLSAITHPRKLQWKSFINIIDETGFRALPILALLSFLIGVVLTYQMGLQLKTYGANIYIVDLSGMAILREFSPLITAILIAGRTSSAFAAHIGTMQVNEEIDALRTFGMSPINRLVLPRVLGLVIAMPLLVCWANIFGILGSIMMSKGMLGISYYDFLQRFQQVVDINNYWIGLSKAPVFALIIAAVGCFQGFRVSMSADSVGHQTTKSVVQALFLIIIADAVFSVFFSMAGV